MPEGTAHPRHEVRAAEVVGEEMAGQLAELRKRRPAAFELAVAVVELAAAFPDTLRAYVAEHPAPAPEAADEDLVAWAERCRRFTARL